MVFSIGRDSIGFVFRRSMDVISRLCSGREIDNIGSGGDIVESRSFMEKESI